MSHLVPAGILINTMVICDFDENPFNGVVDTEARFRMDQNRLEVRKRKLQLEYSIKKS